MHTVSKSGRFFIIVLLVLLSFGATLSAEHIRLDRKHGEVNSVLQAMLSKQISSFPDGQGKIEFGRSIGRKSACTADLFVSPETVFVVVESSKIKAEFYVDHPHDSFKDVLFQALIKQGERLDLSVDKKSASYKFSKSGNDLTIEVKQYDSVTTCKFNLETADLMPGLTE